MTSHEIAAILLSMPEAEMLTAGYGSDGCNGEYVVTGVFVDSGGAILLDYKSGYDTSLTDNK